MDLADETSPSPAARAQAGLILKNHLTSKDHAQVCSATILARSFVPHPQLDAVKRCPLLPVVATPSRTGVPLFTW